MLYRVLSIVFFTSCLLACAHKPVSQADAPQTGEQPAMTEKCQSAKQDFEKAVQAGERDNLHEMKRNIELYCVWRRY